tara:strand:- start:3354 stop:3926 length:573 start_codon:yes stop_codon:yes gene_type:complete
LLLNGSYFDAFILLKTNIYKPLYATENKIQAVIFKKIKKAFKNKKYVFVKKAIRLESFRLDFNFDMMLALWGKNNNLRFENKSIFVGQLFELNSIPIFKTYIDYIETNLKEIFYMGNLDFFFSLKGDVGPTHIDPEHVIILGIKNVTYYHIDNNDLKIEPGDILYIPKGFLHHAFSSRERIVLSLSLWEK